MAICDFDLYKESMQKDEFQDRPSMGALADMLFPVIKENQIYQYSIAFQAKIGPIRMSEVTLEGSCLPMALSGKSKEGFFYVS